jgi:hypothetical protein
MSQYLQRFRMRLYQSYVLSFAIVRAVTHTLQLPFWAIVSFGAYLLFRLGYGVATFNDVPDAHKELMLQIAQAKKELKAKGVSTDS